jgi:hypothetical protein
MVLKESFGFWHLEDTRLGNELMLAPIQKPIVICKASLYNNKEAGNWTEAMESKAILP